MVIVKHARRGCNKVEKYITPEMEITFFEAEDVICTSRCHSKDDYSRSYQARQLLSQNEWHEYKKLQKYATEKGLEICPKVRMLDIVEPRKGEKDYMALLSKVQSKHVDFLICDKDLHIKGVVELDDNSHNRKDRQERDAFVDQILTSVGYKVIHTRAITETTLDAIVGPAKDEEPTVTK